MPKGKELTFFERERIETYLRMKKKILWIAKKLGMSKLYRNVIAIILNKKTGLTHLSCAPLGGLFFATA
ncbi:MAG: hypothetical protein WCK16_03260 [Candidatus Moraniibacteriota bacterium]